jgi:hypothetical protein
MRQPSVSLTLLSLLGFTSAIPTPVDLAPRCGTTLTPTFLQQLTETDPNTVQPNTIANDGDFHVSQSVDVSLNIVDRVYQLAAFKAIPAGSYGCQLAVTFPENYPITSTGNPILNVTTIFKDDPTGLVYPNDFSWSKFSPPSTPPFGQGLFGTVTMEPGTTKVINSENCPTGTDGLGFVFSIASWETQAASVEFKQTGGPTTGSPLAGIYLTYNC